MSNGDGKVIDFEKVRNGLAAEKQARQAQTRQREAEKQLRQLATMKEIIGLRRAHSFNANFIDAMLICVARLRIEHRRGWLRSLVMKPPTLKALQGEIDAMIAERDALVKQAGVSASEKKQGPPQAQPQRSPAPCCSSRPGSSPTPPQPPQEKDPTA